MEKDMDFLKRIFSAPVLLVRLASIGVLLIGVALLLACSWVTISGPQGQTMVPDTYTPPSSFPQTDIVYQRDEELGFVNADGSNITTVPFAVPYNDFVSTWENPMIAGEDEALIVTINSSPGTRGKIFVARAGKVAVDCEWWGIARLAVDGQHILLETDNGQEKYLPEDCGTNNPPENIYTGVSGPLSPDERYAAEVMRASSGPNTASLILREIETGEERVIGEGDLPVWSRDGQWLAYTGPDGIYIVQNSPGAEPSRLVALEILHPELGRRVYTEDRADLYYPPIASWSPDGQWLVYHVYSTTSVDPNAKYAAQHYSIFKVNVNTGETTKLLDGGYYPFWRWPVEEP